MIATIKPQKTKFKQKTTTTQEYGNGPLQHKYTYMNNKQVPHKIGDIKIYKNQKYYFCDV